MTATVDPPLAFEVEVAGNVVTARGELDLAAVDCLRRALDTARTEPRRPITVDLVGVTYLDSPIVSVLFEQADRLSLRLAAKSMINRMLSLTGLLSLPGVRISYPPRD
jgi:anti-sigma B factor antagonist